MITPSGGLVYHARALRGHDLWFPTRRLVSHWLETWLFSVKPEHLIVFGPSAGYLFESGIFQTPCLRHLTIVEPDAIAKPLFRLRHLRPRGTSHGPPQPDLPPKFAPTLRWYKSSKLLPHTSRRETDFADFLGATSSLAAPDKTSAKTAVFFAGLLGQLEFHRESFRRDEMLARRIFLKTLQKFPWASLHDLESSTLPRALQSALVTKLKSPELASLELPTASLENQTLRIEWLESALKTDPSLFGTQSTWVDHATDWLGAPSAAGLWRLTPTKLHVLGFVQHAPD